ncbi:MAG: UbiD family decarboxylase, partial [Candidatus Eremiobacteraeota bacterium]|nr:UbiD family decarboxylase [Candidatus Eremiobacteraeota bacterium]
MNVMAFDSLRAFVDALRRAGELHTVDASVDPYLEISEITDRTVKAGGPALLFTNVRGSKFPVLTNQFGSHRRMAMALGAESLDAAADRIRSLIDLKIPGTLGERLLKLASLAPLANLIPRTQTHGSVQDVVIDAPNLHDLPVLTTWPLDGGPFITLPLVITKDPQSGAFNVGMYRVQVYDERTTGMHWQRHKQGRAHAQKWGDRIPVAIAIGSDPVLTYAAT